MTRTVIANFPDGDAARRAASALGRTELAAGPTRVRVDASGGARPAKLELRVEDPDAPRAIALLREHGAEVDDGAADGEGDLRSGGPLAGWGMAVADAVTAAMGGATASDAQVPAGAAGRDRPAAGGRGPHAGAPDGAVGARASGPIVGDPRAVPGGGADAAHGPASQPSMAAPGAQRVIGEPGDGASMIASEPRGEVPREFDKPAAAGQAVVTGNAPSADPGSQVGTASGSHISDTAGAGTETNLGQIGPGTDLRAGMGATDITGTASGTRTKADPKTQQRADDVPMRDPRPPQDRQVSDA